MITEEIKNQILDGKLQIFANVFLLKEEQQKIKDLFISLTSEECWKISKRTLSTRERFFIYRKEMNQWYGMKNKKENLSYINYKELL